MDFFSYLSGSSCENVSWIPLEIIPVILQDSQKISIPTEISSKFFTQESLSMIVPDIPVEIPPDINLL